MGKVALKPVNIKLCQDDMHMKSSDNKSIEYEKTAFFENLFKTSKEFDIIKNIKIN